GPNHSGYPNPDTRDSFNEGLAEFWAIIGWCWIEPTCDDQYGTFSGLAVENNGLEAWTTSPSGNIWREEFAIAAVLWDLADNTQDTDTT
ncbi:MAG: hypothetical protein GTN89_09030, partial [Acidobacteria bacterium]|nr:hypothetical protein [Acidobacteriota bacterium]